MGDNLVVDDEEVFDFVGVFDKDEVSVDVGAELDGEIQERRHGGFFFVFVP